ncbi:hypothetical protein [Yersinia ruckeri]|uniref:hypothetical protein n=1 Tax=Yersinia ruckeri TaxID=29486 RepID=UPI0004E36AFF|nr:hypothetical protein [Yersinia ruckeri]ARZ00834.1 hypothetical protein QMA0440_01494 [Yersinia ruckeri]KFE39359.1 hypothetical protein nADLYRO1b_1546 [Yersinia ruckeri]
MVASPFLIGFRFQEAMDIQEIDLVKKNRISRCLIAGMILGAFVAQSAPALAVDLPFSANCTNHAAINVVRPDTGITFRKNPNSTATRAATATVFSINGLANITIPANAVSCFYTVQGNDNYCFQASNNAAAFANINSVANTNTAAVPACQ